MIANIIHDNKRIDRFQILHKELTEQNITYAIWPAIKDISPATSVMKAHAQIVKWAKETNQPEVLIMEDDIRFCGPGSFDYYLSNKPTDFDLYLGGIYYGHILPDNTVKKFSALHCYIIHERFYDTFLQAPIKKHLDTHLSELRGKYVVCNPLAAIQHNGFSDQIGKDVHYDHLLKPFKLYNNFSL